MDITSLPYSDTGNFTKLFLDYISEDNRLKIFYNSFPNKENIRQLIDQRNFPDTNRKVLHKALKEQYTGLEISPLTEKNIEGLQNDNTFTITTGHQLNLFTGPLYFVYKIVTVINACKEMKEAYPDYNFVPVYWMATEDHDFEEINYFRLFGEKYSWNTSQTGAVGRFLTEDMEDLLKNLPLSNTLFHTAYRKEKTLAGAVRRYVNELFGKYGVVVLDADHKELKQLFKPIIHDDLMHHAANRMVSKCNAGLNDLGYGAQVFAREINFFYLEGNIRNRIVQEGNNYSVLDTDIHFSRDEMIQCIQESPEKFSPNVILRPLYQEIILPNLAYVGGPAEMVYWLQLKYIFDYYKNPFPALLPRNFALTIPEPERKKIEKTKLTDKELFLPLHDLTKKYTKDNALHELSVENELLEMKGIFDKLHEKGVAIDSTLGPMIRAEEKRHSNSLDKIEKKMLRAEKRHLSDKIRQIEAIKNSLFPGGGLQERSDNLLNFYAQHPDFIDVLVKTFDPFHFEFYILKY